MHRVVVWAGSARADLAGILRHIASDNPDTAKRVSTRLRQAAANLEELATGRAGRVTGTYEKVVPGLPYILAYEIVVLPQGGEIIGILHLIHGARDWQPEQRPSS